MKKKKELTDTQKQILASKLERKEKRKKQLSDTQKQILTSKLERKKEKRQKHKGIKIAFGIVFLILFAIGISITFVSVDKEKPTGTKTQVRTEKSTTEQKKPLVLQTIEWKVEGIGRVRTSCYVRNQTEKGWKDSVSVKLYDLDGGLIFSSWDCSWPEMTVPGDKGATQSWLWCDFKDKTNLMRWGNEYKLIWEWGNQTWTAKVTYKTGEQRFD